jgi:hypothetical protein
MRAHIYPENGQVLLIHETETGRDIPKKLNQEEASPESIFADGIIFLILANNQAIETTNSIIEIPRGATITIATPNGSPIAQLETYRNNSKPMLHQIGEINESGKPLFHHLNEGYFGGTQLLNPETAEPILTICAHNPNRE